MLDRKQLITIAVTAIVSVTFREVFTWLTSFAKASALNPATKQTAKKVFSKNNRYIMFDVAWLAFSIFNFIHVMRDKTPMTRWDVVLICLYLSSCCLWSLSLMWHVIQAFKPIWFIPNLSDAGQARLSSTEPT